MGIKETNTTIWPEGAVRVMPDRKTLTAFLAHGKPTVVFNREEGKFEWLKPATERRQNEIRPLDTHSR